VNARLSQWWQRYETIAVVVVFAAAAGIVASGWLQPGTTCVVGDMRWRYDAMVPPQIAELHLDAERMQVGLGAAAIGGWDGLGDALVVGGQAFVRHTNHASPRDYGLVSNRYFQSNAFVYVPSPSAPQKIYRVQDNTRMEELLQQLAHAYPSGVVAAGALRFAPLRMIAMSKAAIAGESVLAHAAGYYTHPMEQAPESWAYVVLIAADDDTRLAALLPPKPLRTIPAGQALALQLRAAPSSALPRMEDAVAVGQLLKDATVLEGQLALYPIALELGCATSP